MLIAGPSAWHLSAASRVVVVGESHAPRCGSTSCVCEKNATQSSPSRTPKDVNHGPLTDFHLQISRFQGSAGRDHDRHLGPLARRRRMVGERQGESAPVATPKELSEGALRLFPAKRPFLRGRSGAVGLRLRPPGLVAVDLRRSPSRPPLESQPHLLA